MRLISANIIIRILESWDNHLKLAHCDMNFDLSLGVNAALMNCFINFCRIFYILSE